MLSTMSRVTSTGARLPGTSAVVMMMSTCPHLGFRVINAVSIWGQVHALHHVARHQHRRALARHRRRVDDDVHLPKGRVRVCAALLDAERIILSAMSCVTSTNALIQHQRHGDDAHLTFLLRLTANKCTISALVRQCWCCTASCWQSCAVHQTAHLARDRLLSSCKKQTASHSDREQGCCANAVDTFVGHTSFACWRKSSICV